MLLPEPDEAPEPDAKEPPPKPASAPAPLRSEALEAELAMLEAMLPPEPTTGERPVPKPDTRPHPAPKEER
jgi:hypothetical protein